MKKCILDKIKNGWWIKPLVFLGLMLPLLLGYKKIEEIIMNNKLFETKKEINRDIFFSIESNEEERKKISLTGWTVYCGEKVSDIKIIFKATDETHQFLEVAKIHKEKSEFREISEEEKVSFKTLIRKNKFNKGICYEILLNIVGDNSENETSIIIETNKYIYDGILYSYNPLEFYEPEIEDNRIQQVIKEGILYTYDVQQGIWVYEYDNKLYSIVDYNLLNYSGVPGIVTYFYTFSSQNIKNPEYIAYYLKEADYYEKESKKYFVFTDEITDKYVVTYVKTGVYFAAPEYEKWVWSKIVPRQFWND